MRRVVPIVEGDGEVQALPVLLRRLADWRTPGTEPIDIVRLIRVPRQRFVRNDDEFNRHLKLAASRAAQDGWVLILLDADDDCPAKFAPALQQRAEALIPDIPVAVVLANREYEAWFIAGAASLQGQRGLLFEPEDLMVEAERPRDAKGWLSAHRDAMRFGRYDPVLDQPRLSARVDLQQVHDRSRSFRKLCKEWLTHTAQAGHQR